MTDITLTGMSSDDFYALMHILPREFVHSAFCGKSGDWAISLADDTDLLDLPLDAYDHIGGVSRGQMVFTYEDVEKIDPILKVEDDGLMDQLVLLRETRPDRWMLKAAKWLDQIAEMADAEGLTSPQITEDRMKLAQLLRSEAGGGA